MYIQYTHIYTVISSQISSFQKIPASSWFPAQCKINMGRITRVFPSPMFSCTTAPGSSMSFFATSKEGKGMASPESVFETETSSNDHTSRFKMLVYRNPTTNWYGKNLSQLVHDLFHQQRTVSNNTRLFSRATQGSSFYQKACDIMVEKWQTSCL